MLSRLTVFVRENLLVVSVFVVGIVIAAAIGFAAGSVSAAAYAGLVLGLAVGAAISYTQRKRDRLAANDRRERR